MLQESLKAEDLLSLVCEGKRFPPLKAPLLVDKKQCMELPQAKSVPVFLTGKPELAAPTASTNLAKNSQFGTIPLVNFMTNCFDEFIINGVITITTHYLRVPVRAGEA